MSATDADSGLRRGPMLVIAAVGIIAFAVMLMLGAYGPDLASGRNGGTHALSNSATGFSGLVELASATGRSPVIVRNKRQFRTENLLVISPDSQMAPLGPILAERGQRVTLIVLPKWRTQTDPLQRGWVNTSGLLPSFVAEGVLAPGIKLSVSQGPSSGERLTVSGSIVSPGIGFVAPRIVQSIGGAKALLSDAKGRVLLGQIGDRPLYVLADPDLINNKGLANRDQAAAALRLLNDLNSTGAKAIMFDVTANGLGHSPSPLRLAFDPPFLAVTLTLVAAMLLAMWQTLVRFGAPLPTERALAFGKTALIDNSAALVRKAGRETFLGERYARMVRRRAAALLRLPATLDSERSDARLDAQIPGRPFSALAANVVAARTRPELVAAAQSLHQWTEEIRR
jgi:hypothetical protein